ncbi:uncharacterized protein M6G45_016088 isoform 2-T4 [Spheniscus humboldti]
MVLYPRRILVLSLGCSMSSGSRSLGLTLPPASFLFTLMKCDYFPEVSDLGASDASHAVILQPPEAAYFNFTSAAVACLAREGGQALVGFTSAPGQGGILAQPGPGSFRRDDSALRRAAAAVGLEQEKIRHPQDREVSKAERHRHPRAQGRANINPPRTAGAFGSATFCKSTAWATLQPCRFNGSGVLPSPLEKRRKNTKKPAAKPLCPRIQSGVPLLCCRRGPVKLRRECVDTQAELICGGAALQHFWQPCCLPDPVRPSGPLPAAVFSNPVNLGEGGGGPLLQVLPALPKHLWEGALPGADNRPPFVRGLLEPLLC